MASTPYPIGANNDLLDDFLKDDVKPTKSNPWIKAAWILGSVGVGLAALGAVVFLGALFLPVTLSLSTLAIVIIAAECLGLAGGLTFAAGIAAAIIGYCRKEKEEDPTSRIPAPLPGPVYQGD